MEAFQLSSTRAHAGGFEDIVKNGDIYEECQTEEDQPCVGICVLVSAQHLVEPIRQIQCSRYYSVPQAGADTELVVIGLVVEGMLLWIEHHAISLQCLDPCRSAMGGHVAHGVAQLPKVSHQELPSHQH